MRFSALRGQSAGALLISVSLAAALILMPPLAPRAQAQGQAQATAFSQSLAAAAAPEEAIAEWYRSTSYDPLWTGADDAARRSAFLAAIARAGDHGLPQARYDAPSLVAALRAAETEGDRGRVEVEMTRAYLAWARDLTSGALDPKTVDAGIVREIDRIDPQVLLARIASGNPEAVLAGLEPQSTAYLQLMKAKIGLEAQIAAGGWGESVPVGGLAPGATGPAVVALRDRLVRMGYLAPTPVASFDRVLQAAVSAFQLNQGLTADGSLDEATLAEINIGPEARLKQVLVALERERWMKVDTSQRYVWVNLPDFRAKVIDRGQTVYDTRAVIGKNTPDRRTPEFSDVMEHMVINPSWNVPRSITVKEYLPLLQSNPNAVSHLQVLDGNGRVMSRGAVNFAGYSAKTFPFALRQPPSDSNALGKVKFMFPNVNNIYLHDTPAKDLFDKEIRDFSHGCIRLADPFDFAYYLLGSQTDDPKGFFAATVDSEQETTVVLEKPLPVHLVYFTAYPDAKGRIGYRRDIYGRDAALWEALQAAGVELAGVQG